MSLDAGETVRETAVLGDGPGAMAALLEPMLLRAAGLSDLTPVSLTIDHAGRAAPGERLAVEGRLDRATRSLVFVSAAARGMAGGAVAAASAVLRIANP